MTAVTYAHWLVVHQSVAALVDMNSSMTQFVKVTFTSHHDPGQVYALL